MTIPIVAAIVTLCLLATALSIIIWCKRKKECQNAETRVAAKENVIKELLALPQWLKNRPDMIYPQDCIQKEQQLGSGQYGTVFKGKLVLGNSV